jgi:hypothetical protein
MITPLNYYSAEFFGFNEKDMKFILDEIILSEEHRVILFDELQRFYDGYCIPYNEPEQKKYSFIFNQHFIMNYIKNFIQKSSGKKSITLKLGNKNESYFHSLIGALIEFNFII